MAKKCWCGEDTVLEDHTHDEGLASDYMPRKTLTVCPTHGENWRWRECVLAGDVSSKARLRKCRIVSDNLGGAWVTPETCATCPVPALVDAARATLRVRAREETKETYDELLEAQQLADAALAALPEEGKSE